MDVRFELSDDVITAYDEFKCRMQEICEWLAHWGESVLDTLKEMFEMFYITKSPLPNTPYKPKFKKVIFDRRLKTKHCRSNCKRRNYGGRRDLKS